jgi:hypothetical protein
MDKVAVKIRQVGFSYSPTSFLVLARELNHGLTQHRHPELTRQFSKNI